MASVKLATSGIAMLLFVGAVVALLSPSILSTADAQNTQIVAAGCNTDKISGGSPQWNNVGDVLEDLEKHTADNGYSYKTQKSGGGCTTYGEATCNQGLSKDECKACLTDIGDKIWGICGNTVGARVYYVDCYIRYEEYEF